jgi:serine protease AprX
MKWPRLVLVLILSATLAFSATSKLSPDLQPYTTSLSRVNVIVQFNQPLTASLLNSVLSLGATLLGELPLVNGALYSITGLTLNLVAALPGVKYMTPDRLSVAMLDYSQPTVNANIALQYGWDGNNIGIAVIDSGITPVADLNYTGSNKSRVVYNQNFSDSTTNTSDQFGHGTHVAGILAGNGANSTGSGYTRTFMGIAPRAQLINLRVLNGAGQGNDSAVIQALSQAIQLKSQYNIRVVNLSLGRGIFESYTQDPLCQAVEQAWKAGLVVVVAAGNYGRDNSQNTNGYARITSPGNDPYVITIGAMKTMGTANRSDDLIASYSSKGPTLLDHIVKPDI